jgi:hypothetical protein
MSSVLHACSDSALAALPTAYSRKGGEISRTGYDEQFDADPLREGANAMKGGAMKAINWLLAIGFTMLLGCATGATKQPSVDVTGTWAGEYVAGGDIGSGSVTMTLQQTGVNVTGEVVVGGAIALFSGPVTGTVSGDALSLSYRGGTGEFTVKGNEMSGSSRLSRWTLKRQ